MEDYSKDGRKLRPRKVQAAESDRTEKVEFNQSGHKPFHGERSFGHKPFGHKPFGHKPFGHGASGHGRFRAGGRPYENSGSDGSRSESAPGRDRERRYGNSRPYGSRDGQEGGRRRSYGSRDGQGEGQHRSYGSRYGQGGQHRPYGSREGQENGKDFGAHRSSFGERRNYGGDKPFRGRRPFPFNKRSEEGIDRMINRRPLVGATAPAESVETGFQEEVRLNKFIANSGVCSRREADTLIQAGVVTVNGEVVTELGVKVNVLHDDVRFNGEKLKGEEKVYLILNKPCGYVTTASDPHADRTVMELIKGCEARVYPVGRLDKNTTGVLMFTNDGEIAEKLCHPAYDKKKIYQVSLDRPLAQEDYDRILGGIELSDGSISADSLEYIDESDKRKLGIEIHSGKNRIVRRIFEELGYNVKALDRVYFAGLTKKGLKRGEWRFLNEGEVNILKMGAYM